MSAFNDDKLELVRLQAERNHAARDENPLPPLQGPVTVEKYTFVVPADDYRVHCHRHGEPWYVFDTGCKAVAELMSRVEELESQQRAVWKRIKDIGVDLYDGSGPPLEVDTAVIP